MKTSAIKKLNGICINLLRQWIEYQMSPEMNWRYIQIDSAKPNISFDLSKDEELREMFNWKNMQPLLKNENLQKQENLIALNIDRSLLGLINLSS